MAGAQARECWSVSSTVMAEALGSRLEELVLHQQLREELLASTPATRSKQVRCLGCFGLG